MNSRGFKKRLAFSLAVIGSLVVALPIIFFSYVFYERDARTIRSFHELRQVASQKKKMTAFVFEHIMPETPAYNTYYEEIVALSDESTMSVGELMLQMKTEKAIFRADMRSPKNVDVVWLDDSTVRVACSGCLVPPVETLRRATRYGNVSVQYVGLPNNQAYTNTSPVEVAER